MTVDKEQAITKLEKQIAVAAELKTKKRFSPEFDKWKRDTEVLIRNIFRPYSQHLNDFRDVDYDLRIWTSGTPDSVPQKAYEKGLDKAEAILLSFVDEIKDFYPDKKPIPDDFKKEDTKKIDLSKTRDEGKEMRLRKQIKKAGSFIIAAAILYVLNSWVFPRLFNKSIIKFLTEIDGIYYAFAIGIFNIGLTIYLYFRLKNKITNRNRDQYIGFSNVDEAETSEIKPDHKAILEILIRQDNFMLPRSALSDGIKELFPQMNEVEIGIKLKEMQRLGYVKIDSSLLLSTVAITDKATELLSKLHQLK